MSNETHIRLTDHVFDDEDTTLRFTVDDGATTPVAVDISGWTVEFVLRESPTATPAITKTVGAGITLTTPPSGILDVALSATDVAALGGVTYEYVLRRTGTGTAKRLAFGEFTIGA